MLNIITLINSALKTIWGNILMTNLFCYIPFSYCNYSYTTEFILHLLNIATLIGKDYLISPSESTFQAIFFKDNLITCNTKYCYERK